MTKAWVASAVVLSSLSVGLGACALRDGNGDLVFSDAPRAMKAGGYKGMSLPKFVETLELTPEAKSDADFVSPFVRVTSKPKDNDAMGRAGGAFNQWCDENGGQMPYVHQNRWSASFYTATNEYALTHPRANGPSQAASNVCVDAQDEPIAAVLTQDFERMVIFDRPALEAFVGKFEPPARAREKAAQSQQDNEADAKAQAFKDAVLALDKQSDPALSKVPLASESIQFIGEKLGQDGIRPFGKFEDEPCQFKTYGRDTLSSTTVNLRKLNLGTLEHMEERNIDTMAGERRLAYGIGLSAEGSTGYVELNNADSAIRVAKAFSALARRCGAKVDDRFR